MNTRARRSSAATGLGPTRRVPAPAAPEAVQGADRWHLWHNLGEHVEKEVARHRLRLPGPAVQPGPDGQPEPSGDFAHAAAYAVGHVLPERTHARYRRVHELLGQGASMHEAARELGLR